LPSGAFSCALVALPYHTTPIDMISACSVPCPLNLSQASSLPDDTSDPPYSTHMSKQQAGERWTRTCGRTCFFLHSIRAHSRVSRACDDLFLPSPPPPGGRLVHRVDIFSPSPQVPAHRRPTNGEASRAGTLAASLSGRRACSGPPTAMVWSWTLEAPAIPSSVLALLFDIRNSGFRTTF
jgi:hypothetical protein